MKIIILLITGMILLSRGFCQDFTHEYDSLPFSKPEARKMHYIIPHPLLTDVTLNENDPDSRVLSSKQLYTDILFGIFGLFTNAGLTLSNEMDVVWELSAMLECNDSYLNWRVALLCTGTQANEREQISNDDGSHWTEVTRTSYFDWENSSVGLIQEKNDTICKFYIIMDPREDPGIKPWSDEIYAQKSKPVPTRSKSENYKSKLRIPCIDYAITGQFRGKDFVLITHGGIRKSYFYINDELACIFSPDVDDYRVKEQDRRMPLIMLDSSISFSERPDWYRLAVMSRFLNSQLERKTYVH